MDNTLTLTLPNVSYAKSEAWLKERFPNTVFENKGINAFLHVFIERLAIKHPEWVFEATAPNRQTDGTTPIVSYSNFSVYENGEELGRIYKTYSHSRGVYQYEVTNQRIRAGLRRGDSLRSINIEKAIKLVEKNFYATTRNEKFIEAMELAGNSLERARDSIRGRVGYTWRSQSAPMVKYILSNWDDFLTTLNAEQMQVVGGFKEMEHEGSVVDAFYRQIASSKVHRLMIQGSKYLVSNKQGGEINVFDPEDLPETLRTRLGLLKLVEDGTMLENMGYRYNETTFFLYGDSNE